MQRRAFMGGAATALAAATLPRRLHAASDLASDLDLVRRAIALHPGALRYLTPDALDAAFSRLDRDYLAAPDLAGRFLALTRFLSALRCGHTHCNFYNQAPAVRAELFDRRTRLPFFFRWLGARMIVTRDVTADADILRGSEVLSIDGRPVAELLAALMPLVRADGGNDGKRRSLLEVTGGERYPAFDILQGLLFPPRGGRFRIALRTPDGRSTQAEVAPLAATERLAAAPPLADDGTPLWRWEKRDDGIVLLTMPSWVVYRSGWNWGGWLLERQPQLADARGFVIDIRGNEGGLNCGDPILARLATHDLRLDWFERRVRFRRSPPELDAYFDTPAPGFRTLGADGVPLADGFFGTAPDAPPEILRATPPQLAIPTAVLTDASNSSATFLFAHRIRRFGLARLFGETTGGNLRGINAGAMFFVRLPGSGIEFDLPLIGYFPPPGQPDEGVAPDTPVATTAQDVALGRDPVLDAAIGWIHG